MAGDIGIQETVLVVAAGAKDRFEERLGAVRSELGMLHRYGPRVVIGEIPDRVAATLAESLPGTVAYEESEDVSIPNDLDSLGQLGLEAFALRQSEEYARAESERPHDGEPWDMTEAEPPDPPPGTVGAPKPLAAPFPTSERLVGSVAVGVVVVSGPGNLQFSQAEIVEIAAKTQQGLSWLGAQSVGGGVTWTYDLHAVPITAPPDPHAPNLEAVWRDPTMAALGYQGSEQGVLEYVKALRDAKGTRWSYCAFFIKYEAIHFAYAEAPRIVLQSPYDGVGVANLDRVVAHETGHVFGAADEYAKSNCDCGGSWGIFGRANGNCTLCAPGGGVPCIMGLYDWTACPWTTWHLGFYWPIGIGINENDATPASPTAAIFNNRAYLFWKANDAGNRICCSSSQDGLTWPNGRYLNGSDATPAAPAAVVFNNRLYLFWIANDGSNRIQYSSSQDGTTWPAGQYLNASDASPDNLTAAVFNNRLYLFWIANDPGHRLCYSSSQDGVTWPNGRYLNTSDASPVSPGAAVFNNRLYLFWVANDGSNRIQYSSSQDGAAWPNGQPLNGSDTSPGSPTAVAFNNGLYLFWIADDATRRICYTLSPDGATWPTGRYTNGVDASPQPVTAVAPGNRLAMIWAGASPGHRILSTFHQP